MNFANRDEFLEPSPAQTDGGELIGKDPRYMPADRLRKLGHPESILKAVRAKCVDCSGGNMAEVRKCTAVNCALWPFRMAKNPFHRRSPALARPGGSADGTALVKKPSYLGTLSETNESAANMVPAGGASALEGL